MSKSAIYFIYDGECPMCSNAAMAYRLKEKFGTLHLINAREAGNENPIIQNINARGIDLDNGMVIIHDGQYYHGKSALKFMAKHGAPKDGFNVILKSLFWSNSLAHIAYPWMRGTRNWLLRRKNVGRIDNLNLKAEPIFKSVFGANWEMLPSVMQKHYAIRPYSDDRVTVEGALDVMCAGPVKWLAPLFWFARNIPPVNEKDVPVTVHFESDPDRPVFHFKRIFYFKNRKPYHFHSKMMQRDNGEVVEIMKSGFCWRMHYLWEDGKVILRHKGYALYLLGHFIPLPITWLIGRGDAHEWAVSENRFEMAVAITHPWWGKIYEYKGWFEVRG